MADRFSTEFLEQLGARRNTVSVDGTFVNTFQDRTGVEQALNAAATALSNNKLRPATLNIEEFLVAKCFYENRGLSETTATTMAVISLDAAKIQGMSVMKFLEPMRQNGSLSFESIVAANLLRPASSQQTFLVEKSNKKSPKARNVIP
jgi:hypothetical protein